VNLPLIALLLLLLSAGCKNESDNSIELVQGEYEIATCYGKDPCAACKSCNYCKHCKVEGGTCGVCVKGGDKKPVKEKSPAKSGQCKATTKKGTRCSRAAKASGYCWQHE